MPSLYIIEQGSILKKLGERLVIEKDGIPVSEVQLIKVDTILIYGGVQVTTPALNLIFDRGIELSFLTLNGKLKGKVTPVKSKNIFLRLSQYKTYFENVEFRISSSKNILKAKLLSQMSMLKQFEYKYPEVDFFETYNAIDDVLSQINNKNSTSSLMGLEGYATKNYFKAFAKMFRGDIKFSGRNRRPPQDEANALLSLTYVMLTNEISSLLEAIGFDPYIGFYHSIDYGRPGLALDILEIFRVSLCDRFVLSLCNRKEMTSKDFEKKEGGVFLTTDGLKKYFAYYERYMNEKGKNGLNWREKIKTQAHNLSEAFLAQKAFEVNYQEE